MRKVNKILMILVSVLLCSVLITSTVISGTLAKYTTTHSSSDSARVAKWGIEITSGSDLSYEYNNAIGSLTVSAQGDLSDVDGVVAPGTSGRLAWIQVSGKPEVMYDINVEGTVDIEDGYLQASRLLYLDGRPIEYMPIVFKICKQVVGGNKEVKASYGINNSTLTNSSPTKSELLTELSAGLSSVLDSSSNAPNTDTATIYSVEWEWPYTPSGEHQTTEKDTVLGEAILKNIDKFDISASLTFTIPQSQGS